MFNLKHILKELSDIYHNDYNGFIDKHYPTSSNQLYLLDELSSLIRQWVGFSQNKKGMRVELFMKQHPEVLNYIRSTLRKKHGNTVQLFRGLKYLTEEERNIKDIQRYRKKLFKLDYNMCKMIKQQKGIVDLYATRSRYSSWTRSERILNRFSWSTDNLPINGVGFKLHAEIPVDTIIFCGELFPRTIDEVTDEEYIVKHNQAIEAHYNIGRMGGFAKKVFFDHD